MKCSPSIWHYVVNFKSTVKILSVCVAFLENMNFILKVFCTDKQILLKQLHQQQQKINEIMK